MFLHVISTATILELRTLAKVSWCATSIPKFAGRIIPPLIWVHTHAKVMTETRTEQSSCHSAQSHNRKGHSVENLDDEFRTYSKFIKNPLNPTMFFRAPVGPHLRAKGCSTILAVFKQFLAVFRWCSDLMFFRQKLINIYKIKCA